MNFSEGGELPRLLRKADEQMSEPENSRRQNALAHLRAAVMSSLANNGAGLNTKKYGNDSVAFKMIWFKLSPTKLPREAKGPLHPKLYRSKSWQNSG